MFIIRETCPKFYSLKCIVIRFLKINYYKRFSSFLTIIFKFSCQEYCYKWSINFFVVKCKFCFFLLYFFFLLYVYVDYYDIEALKAMWHNSKVKWKWVMKLCLVCLYIWYYPIYCCYFLRIFLLVEFKE